MIKNKNKKEIIQKIISLIFVSLFASILTAKAQTNLLPENTIIADSPKMNPTSRFTAPYFEHDQNDFSVKFGDKDLNNENLVRFEAVPVAAKKDEQTGIWQRITSFFNFGSQTKKGIDFELVNKTNFNNLFSSYENDNSPVANSENDLTSAVKNLISWSNQNNNPVWWEKSFNEIKRIIIGKQASHLSNLKEDNQEKIVNKDILPNTDLKYQILNSGIKEDIVINTSTDTSDTYIFKLNLDDGVTWHQALAGNEFGIETGLYYFTDNQNKYIGHFRPLVAYDAIKNKTTDVKMQIVDLENNSQVEQSYIVVTIDRAWLNDSARSFPITIDPTIVHDTKAEFDAGTLNRLEATAVNRTQLKYNELPADFATVGLWHFNETTGQVANDSSGNVNNGQLGSTSGSDANDPTWNTTSQKLGASALTFDGTSDYVQAPSSNSLNFSANQDFTIELWIKVPATQNDTDSNNNSILEKWDNTAGYPFAIRLYNQTHPTLPGRLSFTRYDGTNGVSFNSSKTVNDNQWHHIVYEKSGNQLLMYIDGSFESSTIDNVTGTTTNSSALTFGRRNAAGPLYDLFYTGSIDEPRISNRALSPEEIKQDAQYRPYGVYTSSVLDLVSPTPVYNNFSWNEYGVRTASLENDLTNANLVAQWNFNETNGTTASNNAGSCGSACDGSLNNFADTSGVDVAPISGWTTNNRLEYGADGDQSLMFDGVDDYVSVPDNSLLNPSGSFSVSTWFKASNISGQTIPPLIKKSSNSSGYGLEINNTTQNIAFWVYTGGGWISSQTYKINTSDWYYAVGVYDGSYLRLYVNGSEIGSPIAASNTIMSSNPLNIGRDPVNTTRLFNGIIESPKIYSLALSADEINSNYQAGDIEFQTRTGTTTTPDDGSWESWRSTSTAAETAVDNFDSNENNTRVYNWSVQNINTNQNWVKKNNSVPANSDTTSTDGRIPLGTAGKGDATHTTGPQVIKDGSTYKMWYSGTNSTTTRIFYATSTDGLNWTKLDNTIPTTCDSGSACSYGNGRIGLGTAGKADSSGVINGSTIKDGSTYKMWYTAYNGLYTTIAYAYSSDGLTWTKQDNTIPTTCDSGSACSYGNGRIGLGTSGKADSSGISVGSVIKDGGTYKMWYIANNGSYSTIAYAYSSDGLTWTKADNTIPAISDKTGTNGRISKGNAGTAESNYINDPKVIKDGSVYKMWYIGQDGTHSYTLYATSMDGLNWIKYDNSIPAVSDGSNSNGRVAIGTSTKFDADKLFSPMVIKDNNKYSMWYQGSISGSTVYRIGYASMASLPLSENAIDTNIKMEGTGSERCIIGQAQADAGTVGLWHFEETSGTAAYIKDSSDNANNGTPTGTTLINGISGKGRSFNGTSNFIALGSPASLNLTGEMTVEAWIYPKNVSTLNQFISQANSSGTGGVFNFEIGRTANKLGVNWGNTPLFTSQGSLQANQWYHVAFTRSGSTGSWTMKLYINGFLDSSQTTATNPGSQQPADIGRTGDQSANYFNGFIDEVRISNIDRSATEIAESYRMGADYHMTRSLPTNIDLAITNNKLPLQIASDRPGTSLMLTAGESPYTNYESDINTVGLWHLDDNNALSTSYDRECTDTDPVGTLCGGGKKFATGLVAMPSGCANSISEPACSGTDAQTKTWASATGTNEPADSLTDGLTNTNNLYASNPPTNPAADFCHDLIKNGFTDWYLPAQSELNTLYTQRATVGGFAVNYYWSSSEYNVSAYTAAYLQHMSIGTQTTTTKTSAFGYRCIRQYTGNKYTISDSSISNNSGSSNGTDPVQGKIGQARYFSDANDYISFNDTQSLKNLSAFTLEGWFYPTNISSSNISNLFGKITDASNADYWIRIIQNGAVQLAFMNSGGTEYALNGGLLTNNTWNHLVGTYDPATGFKIYVNGVLSASGCTVPTVCTGSAPRQTTSSLIFAGTNISNAAFTGAMDEIRISNIARTPTEIRQEYEAGLRSHVITVDFVSGLNLADIAGTGPTSTNVTLITLRNDNMINNVFVGDTIIVKENYNGTEYSVQGLVNGVNTSARTISVNAFTGTIPNFGTTLCGTGVNYCYTTNAVIFKWQKENIEIYKSLAGHRDQINQISLRILDGNQGQNIWLDDLKTATPFMTNPLTNAIQSTPHRYFQYRFFVNTTDTDPTPSVDNVTLDYSTITLDHGSTSQTYLNSTNRTAFNTQCNGVTDATTGNTVYCEGSWNQTDWYTVNTTTSPLSNANITGTPNVTIWNGYPSDGSVTLYVRARDGSESSTVKSFSVTKDVINPTTSAAITSGTLGNNSWYTTNVGVTITPVDATSGIASTVYCVDQANTCTPGTSYSSPVTISTENTNYFRYFSTDNAGNVQTTQSLTVKVDKSNPTTSAAITSGTLGNNSWYTTNAEVTVTPADATSGLASTVYCVDQANTCTPGTSYSSPVTISTENTNYFRYFSTDNAGNVQTTQSLTVKLDKSNPTTSAAVTSGTLGNNSWYTTNAEVTVTPADATSGIAATVYCVDQANTCTPSTTYSTPITVSTENTNYVRYFSTDNAGNIQTTQSLTVKVDKSNPTTSAAVTSGTLGNNSWYTTNAEVTVTPADATSGLASTVYCVDQANTCTPGTSYSSPVTISTENTNYFRYFSTDNAGNIQTTQSLTVKVDKSNPTSGNVNNLDEFSNNTNMTISVNRGTDSIAGMSSVNSDYLLEVSAATLSGSGCGTFGSYIDSSVSETASATSYNFTGTTGNCYQFRYTVKDAAGNGTTYTGTNITKLDSSVPNIVAVDAGAAATDRTSLTSDLWYGLADTGNDGQISYSWSDPASPSGDYFYYLENDSTANAFNESGLVGWWSFENDNTTTAVDHSGNGNDGTLNGTSIVTGQLGQGRTFNGSSDYINAGTDSSLNITGDITVALWMKKPNATGKTLVRRDDFTNYTVYADTFPSAWFYDSTCSGSTPAGTVTGTTHVDDNLWHQIVYTRSGSTMKLFVDGNLEDTKTATATVSCGAAAPFYIGAAMDPVNYPYNFFTGQIDEVKIYNRALTTGDVLNEYKKRLTQNPYLDNQTANEGTYYRHVRPISGADNWGTERYFISKYDNTPPTVSATGASRIWRNSNIAITLHTNDSFSGLNYSKYIWDNNDAACRSSGTAFNDNDTINIISNGTHNLHLCNQDHIGLTNSWHDTYKLNDTIPDIVAIDSGPSSSDRTSFSSGFWFNYLATGSDDQGSFSWHN